MQMNFELSPILFERRETQKVCYGCGMCCLQNPSAFVPQDFVNREQSTPPQAISDEIDSGRASIITEFFKKIISGSNFLLIPIFCVQPRRVGASALDLVSFGDDSCSLLTDSGCYYKDIKNRPYGCAILVPRSESSESSSSCLYPPIEGDFGLTKNVLTMSWAPDKYQNLLRAEIEKRSGKTWQEELHRQMNDPDSYGGEELYGYSTLRHGPLLTDKQEISEDLYRIYTRGGFKEIIPPIA